MNVQQLVQKLGLISHVEGGYFREIYRSKNIHEDRSDMTMIYYMLTAASPVDSWHINKSDIVHSHILGGSLHYFMIYPDGSLQSTVVGKNLQKGEELTLIVPGGVWKACYLQENQQYGMITQAVSPGFDYHDMQMIKDQQLLSKFPQQKQIIQKIRLIKQKAGNHQ